MKGQIMKAQIFNNILRTPDLVFASDVINPDTQEILIERNSKITYANLVNCLTLGIDEIDIEVQTK